MRQGGALLRGANRIGSAAGLIIAISSLGLSACATGQIAILSATDLSTKTSAAIAQTKTYLAEVQQHRLAANVDLVASDPSCVWANAIIIHQPTPAELASGRPAPLCTDGAHRGANDFEYDLRPISAEQLKPTLALVGAISDYESAMDKILGQKSPNISTELTALNTDANDAIAIANRLKAANIKNPLSAGQLSAAAALIQVAADINQQLSTASDLKQFTDKEDEKVGKAIAELQNQIKTWQTVSVEGDDEVAVSAMERALRQSGDKWDFNTRRAFLTTLATTQADIGASDQATNAIVDALSKVQAAQKDLHDVLLGKLSDDEKEKRSELERQQIVQAFQAIAGAFSAF